MKDDLAKKTVMVEDNGLFISLAATLARTFGKVYYHCPYVCAFPKMNLGLLGYGVPNLVHCKDPYKVKNEIDLWCYPDIGFGGKQDDLRSEGHRVWGSGSGEDLELDRVATYKLMAKMGYPVQHYEVVTGIDDLRLYLQEHKKVHVKISEWRGSFETFYSPDYDFIKSVIDDIECNKLGDFGSITQFICEDDLPDKIEWGLDTYNIDGVFPKKVMSGIEIKMSGYIGCTQMYTDIIEPLTRYETMLGPYFKKKMYRGFWSAEKRIGRDLVPYMIDSCARAASPPNELYQENITNLAEIIWYGAAGIMVEPVYAKKWGAELIIDSSWAKDHFLTMSWPKEYNRFVKPRLCFKTNGKWHTAPQASAVSSLGGVIGMGDTMASAVEMALEVASSLSGFDVQIAKDALGEAEEKIAKAASMGISLLGRKVG